MNNDESTKNPISNEILLNNKINDSFSFNMDLEQNYNKLYSNFEIKEKIHDFWDALTYKSKEITPSNKLCKLYQRLNYKDYRINKENKNKNKNLPLDKIIKKGRNNKKNNLNMNLMKNNNITFELNLDENNVYNRLYNRAFYIKNKILIQRIKNEESLSKTMSCFNMNLNSKKILLNIKNRKNKIKKRINKSENYYKDEETFKPNINKNSIRIFKRMQKDKNFNNKTKMDFSFYDDKRKLNKIKNNIFKNDYENLYNYFNKTQYIIKSSKNVNNNSKSLSNIPIQKTIMKIEKNENNKVNINSNKKINPYNLYEKNKIWEKIKYEKIAKNKKLKENLEMKENRKELDLPGKNNYEKYKNKIIKIFSPKAKANNYSLLKKKNSTRIYNLFIKKNEFKNNDREIYNNKNIKYLNYHKQNLKYVNNEGNVLSLIDMDENNKEMNNAINKNNSCFNKFIKLIKESKGNTPTNNKIKVKSSKKFNKIKLDKNSFEYKLKNIKNAFKNQNKIKKKEKLKYNFNKNI